MDVGEETYGRGPACLFLSIFFEDSWKVFCCFVCDVRCVAIEIFNVRCVVIQICKSDMLHLNLLDIRHVTTNIHPTIVE